MRTVDKWLAVLLGAVLVALAVSFLVRRNGAAEPVAATDVVQTDVVQPAERLVVRVDGQQVEAPQPGAESRLADLPVDRITASMVSHVRAGNSFDVLVLTDGSELLLDEHLRERLPADVAYRTTYDREDVR